MRSETMPEYHPGTEIEIHDAVPQSLFRNAIPNTKRYMKHNKVSAQDIANACYEGDYEKLDEMLATGNEKQLFNGDLNQHVTSLTPLHMCAMTGQTECVELMLRAKADPHVRELVVFGEDPEEAKTALDYARDFGWFDTAELLEQGEKTYPYGWYLPEGPTANTKQYGGFEWKTRPPKGWYFQRPGAAVRQGLDPAKYGGYDLTTQMRQAAEAAEAQVAKAAQSVFVPLADPPLPIGLLFPGEGSQYVKMFATVQDIPTVKKMFEDAEEILGYDLLQVCLSGPESRLGQTSVCQPAMFVAGLAGVEKLRGEREEAVTRAQVLAGLFVGEYAALCHAGVFSFKDGLKLVKLRGEAMEEASAVGKQLMISVAGLEKETLAALCAKAAEATGGISQIANELFAKGYCCSGTEAAIMHLKELVENAKALQAKVHSSSGAFFTSLMEPAQDKLAKALDEMLPTMSPPKMTVFMNCSGEPMRPGTDPKIIAELLKQELTSCVLWDTCVKEAISDGVSEFYEVGPMKQLKSMMKRIDRKAWGSTKNIEV